MKAKKIALLVIYILLGIIAVGCLALVIGAAFDARFAIEVEWYVDHSWGWSGFNIVTWGIIFTVIAVGLLVIILAVRDEKLNKPVRRRRTQSGF